MHSGAFEEKAVVNANRSPRPSALHRPPGFAPSAVTRKIHRNIFKKVTFFRARKTTTQMTTKNHQFTTFSPQKNHPKHAQERATPCKNRGITTPKKSPQQLPVKTDS
jgi:hypothetical protein